MKALSLTDPEIDEMTKVIVCYGLGDFSAIKKWLALGKDRLLIICEDDDQKIRHSREAEDILDNPQAVLLIDFEPRIPLWRLLEKSFQVAAAPGYDLSRFYGKLGYFLNELATKKHQLDLSVIKNFYHNLAALPLAKDGLQLKDAFKGIPAIVAGAGYSLMQDKEALEAMKDRVLIFGAGTGLNLLNSYGIEADFGGGFDPSPMQLSRIRMNEAFETPFFYKNRFYSEALDEIHGSKIWLDVLPEWFKKRLGLPDWSEEFEAISTSNYLASAALFLGCEPVVLSGIDLSYANQLRYAPGAYPHPLDPEAVKNSYTGFHIGREDRVSLQGKVVSTSPGYMEEGLYFSRMANGKLFNSAEGLGIPNVPHKPLKDFQFQKRDVKKLARDVVNRCPAVPVSIEALKSALEDYKDIVQCEPEVEEIFWSRHTDALYHGARNESLMKDLEIVRQTRIDKHRKAIDEALIKLSLLPADLGARPKTKISNDLVELFYPTGAKKRELRYSHGKRVSEKYWEEDGTLRYECFYNETI